MYAGVGSRLWLGFCAFWNCWLLGVAAFAGLLRSSCASASRRSSVKSSGTACDAASFRVGWVCL